MSFDMRVVEKEIEGHMADQPYSVTCAACGKDLVHTAEIDSDYDITLSVKPCVCCDTEAPNA